MTIESWRSTCTGSVSGTRWRRWRSCGSRSAHAVERAVAMMAASAERRREPPVVAAVARGVAAAVRERPGTAAAEAPAARQERPGTAAREALVVPQAREGMRERRGRAARAVLAAALEERLGPRVVVGARAVPASRAAVRPARQGRSAWSRRAIRGLRRASPSSTPVRVLVGRRRCRTAMAQARDARRPRAGKRRPRAA